MNNIKDNGMFCFIRSLEKIYLYDAVIDEIIEIDKEIFNDISLGKYESKNVSAIKEVAM